MSLGLYPLETKFTCKYTEIGKSLEYPVEEAPMNGTKTRNKYGIPREVDFNSTNPTCRENQEDESTGKCY